MYGCFSFCLVTCKLDNFLKNRTIKLLEDKLLPDFYHGFFWSVHHEAGWMNTFLRPEEAMIEIWQKLVFQQFNCSVFETIIQLMWSTLI